MARMGEAEERLMEALERYHGANPLEAGAPVEAMRSSQFGDAPDLFSDHLLRRLEQSGRIRFDEDLVRKANHQIRMQADEQVARDRLVGAFEAAGLQVPGVKDLLATLPIDGPRAQRVLAALLRGGSAGACQS